MSRGNFDAAALVDEQLQRVKTDELRRRVQQLDGQQAAQLLQAENAHQGDFLHLQAEWQQKTREFDSQAKRRQSELEQKHRLELHRLEQVFMLVSAPIGVLQHVLFALMKFFSPFRSRMAAHKPQLESTVAESCS